MYDLAQPLKQKQCAASITLPAGRSMGTKVWHDVELG